MGRDVPCKLPAFGFAADAMQAPAVEHKAKRKAGEFVFQEIGGMEGAIRT